MIMFVLADVIYLVCSYFIEIPNTKWISSTAGLATTPANTGNEKESDSLISFDAFKATDVNLNPDVEYTALSQGVKPADMPKSTPFTENG